MLGGWVFLGVAPGRQLFDLHSTSQVLVCCSLIGLRPNACVVVKLGDTVDARTYKLGYLLAVETVPMRILL